MSTRPTPAVPTGTVVSRGYLAPRAVDGVRGRVRATFARCAYVTVDGGPALVLHASGGDHTPTSLCPAAWPPAGSPIAVGDPVAGRAGHLKVGELVLDVRGAREWRPAPAQLPAAIVTGDARGRRTPASNPPPAVADGGARVWRPPASNLPPAVVADHSIGFEPALRAASRRTGELLPALEHALAARDAARVGSCVASLVGRGPGLTPSGDDALVGLLAALHRLAPSGEGSPAVLHRLAPAGEGSPAALLRRAVAASAHRTADISAHYLRLAAGGHFGERLIALCDALAAGPQDEVDSAAAAVAATGATSGADALLGVATGMRLVAATGAGGLPVAATAGGQRAVAA